MATKTLTAEVEPIFRALSDRTRLRILNLLREGELCVCDLVSLLDVAQSSASRHLAYLRKAGLVLARKDGLWHYYRLSTANSGFHKKLLECLAECGGVIPELASDTRRLHATGRSNCCD
jgi:ArsR family transcriptional regulator